MEAIRTFSINLPDPLYQQLLTKAGRGRVSTFIRELVKKELGEESNISLMNEYREAYQNPQLLATAKKWEKAEIKSWLNYEQKRARK